MNAGVVDGLLPVVGLITCYEHVLCRDMIFIYVIRTTFLYSATLKHLTQLLSVLHGGQTATDYVAFPPSPSLIQKH